MKLNTFELDKKIKTLVARERELLHEILQTLKEIDERKTYLELGFSSLFAYLTEGIGYSAGSAQRRIEAMRLLKELPELGPKIQSGELNLNQISMVQKASREVYKTSAQKVSASKKRELLASITEKNHQDSQKTVAAFFDLPVIQTTKQTIQADESVRLQLTLPKELYAKIQQAQSLLSHSLADQDLLTYLEYVTDRVIRQKTSIRPPTSTVEVSPPSQAFSARTKKMVLAQQPCCQYVDPITSKKCQSRWHLQVDHKHSRWAGGDNRRENAQILCAAHNQMKYRQETGLRRRGCGSGAKLVKEL